MNNFSLALIVLNTMIGMFSAHIPLHSYFYLRKNVSVLFIPQMRPSFKLWLLLSNCLSCRFHLFSALSTVSGRVSLKTDF